VVPFDEWDYSARRVGCAARPILLDRMAMAETREAVRIALDAPDRPMASRFGRWLDVVSPWHLFAGVLLLQAALVLFVPSAEFFGDESRYVKFAENLLDGYYTPASDPDLTNGPGYPLVLVPLVAVDAPLVVMRLTNALWLAAAAVMMYRALLLVSTHRAAVLGAMALALYPPSLYWGSFLYTEAFSVFLMTAFNQERASPSLAAVTPGACLRIFSETFWRRSSALVPALRPMGDLDTPRWAGGAKASDRPYANSLRVLSRPSTQVLAWERRRYDAGTDL
jgi:hypothetical protein